MAYSGDVAAARTHVTRWAVLLGAIACLAVLPAAAFAQDSLPDPNGKKSEKTSAKRSSANDELAETGLPAVLLLTAGLSLLAAGTATRPSRRRRRAYNDKAWRAAVRSGSYSGR